MDLNVSYRATLHSLSLLPNATLAVLQARLDELTSVPPSHQKLIFKGKKATSNDEETLEDLGLKSGMKVQLLGPTRQELDEMQSAQEQREKKERILRERAAKAPVKVSMYFHILHSEFWFIFLLDTLDSFAFLHQFNDLHVPSYRIPSTPA